MNARTRQKDRCRYKTLRRNVYPTETIAAKRAEAMTNKCQTPIRQYLCHHCHLWHIGRADITDAWKAVNLKYTT